MSDAAPLGVGDRIGPYELAAVLGRGGIGTVFRARRPDGGDVAVKVLRRDLSEDPIFVRRFAREVRIAGAVQHRHLVPVLEAGRAGVDHYLVMPLIDGGTLAQRLRAEGVLAASEAVRIVAEIAAALDALHRHGLVHRDVKPANILLASDRGALITDFGLARGRADTVLTRLGDVAGTLDYVAPELLRGQAATSASDVYALGCVAYACLAGQPPFAGLPSGRVGLAHLETVPEPPGAWRSDVAPDLGMVVLHALAKDPADRPRTPMALANMLAVAARRPATP